MSNRHFLPVDDYVYTPSIAPNNFRSSRISLDPKAWGPSAWQFLFSVARSYSTEPSQTDRKSMLKFLQSLEYALPCKGCRDHFSIAIKNISSTDLDGPEEVGDWLENLKDEISNRETTDDGNYADSISTDVILKNKPESTNENKIVSDERMKAEACSVCQAKN